MALYPNINLPLAEMMYGRQNWSLVVLINAPEDTLSDKGIGYSLISLFTKLFYKTILEYL